MAHTTKQRAEGLFHSFHDAVGSLRSNHLWERFRTSDPLVALADYRDEFECKVEDTVTRLLGSLQIVSRADLERVEGEIASLRKKTDNLARLVRKSREEN